MSDCPFCRLNAEIESVSSDTDFISISRDLAILLVTEGDRLLQIDQSIRDLLSKNGDLLTPTHIPHSLEE